MPGAAARISGIEIVPKTRKVREDAEAEAEIADPVDDERLDRRRVGADGLWYQKPISR